jgi:hypothetical protein
VIIHIKIQFPPNSVPSQFLHVCSFFILARLVVDIFMINFIISYTHSEREWSGEGKEVDRKRKRKMKDNRIFFIILVRFHKFLITFTSVLGWNEAYVHYTYICVMFVKRQSCSKRAVKGNFGNVIKVARQHHCTLE